jgi:tRNA(fMet)-specific endonuclease VapC
MANSVLTEAELIFGIELRPEAATLHREVNRFLSRAIILPWDSATARIYAGLRAQRHRVRVPEIDMQIAAHALSLNAVLITRDRAFHDIPGLVCEDWTRPATS